MKNKKISLWLYRRLEFSLHGQLTTIKQQQKVEEKQIKKNGDQKGRKVLFH